MKKIIRNREYYKWYEGYGYGSFALPVRYDEEV